MWTRVYVLIPRAPFLSVDSDIVSVCTVPSERVLSEESGVDCVRTGPEGLFLNIDWGCKLCMN